MKQVAQNHKTGSIRLQETSEPALKRGGVLVETRFSLISIGTESMMVREGKMSLLERAKTRPDQVKKMIQSVHRQGLMATFHKVMNKLDSLTPLGYSLSGVVASVGQDVLEFREGQNVACAGAGYANHAEVNFIPANLVVPAPDSVSLQQAAFTTVGSIALHGFRQGKMQVGETACVIGLGLIGQLLIQILKAAGIRVVGVDLSGERCALAVQQGCAAAFAPDDSALSKTIHRFTGGAGVDCVFIAASAFTSEPVELAAALARDRARIVGVGKTLLNIPYNEFYEKELEYRFSRSYGPGRYDPNYEERGMDYPIGYVRWTERRNMAAFMDLVAQKKVRLDPLISLIVPFHRAEEVYQDIADNKLSGIGFLFEYPPLRVKVGKPLAVPHPSPRKAKEISGVIPIGVVGAGGYASSMLLPHLARHKEVRLVEVVTTTALSAVNALRKFKFARAGTNCSAMLAAEDIDAVVIATRHATHAALTADFLRAGKAVFVEKPLAIDLAGVELVRKALAESGNERLQVGFNRRFAPLAQSLARVFKNCGGPLVMCYRVHAGPIDKRAWLNDPEEGTRFIGEAGHFIDVFSFLTGARPVTVYAQTIRPENPTRDDAENIAVVIGYDDGSVGNLLYLTQGSVNVPKEFLEVFGAGKTAQLNNFESMDVYEGTRRARHGAGRIDKGQRQELQEFVQAIKGGGEMPIPIMNLLDTTLATLAVADSLRKGRPAQLADYWA